VRAARSGCGSALAYPGGMARRTRSSKVAVDAPSEEGAAGRWFRSIRLSGFTVMVLGLIVLAIVVLAPSLRTLVEQRQQIAAVQQQIDDQQAQVDALGDQVARWEDPAYIEAQARERLDYAMPGEFSYKVVDDIGVTEAADDGAVSDEITTTDVDWVQSMLGSVLIAGLTDQPRADDGATDPSTQETQ
jgi:cell division protein FtsB